MKNLIVFEFRKLLKNPLFYILSGAMLAMTVFTAGTYRLLAEAMDLFGEGQSFGNIPGMITSGSAFYLKALSESESVSIAAIFICIFALSDNNGPIKTVISKGYDRVSVFFSKYIVSLVAVLIQTIAVLVFAYPTSLVIFGSVTGLPDNVALILFGQILSVVATHAVFFAVATATGKTVIAILVNVLVPSIIAALLALLDAAIGLTDVTIAQFWIGSLISPFSVTGATTEALVISFVMCAVYTAAGITVGVLFAKKKQY